MSSEDKDILAKISQLAGQINRHKNTQNPVASADYRTKSLRSASFDTRGNPPPQVRHGAHATFNPRNFTRGGRHPPVHRNRTLVLNGTTTPAQTESAETSASDNQPTTTTPSWVTKTDRHMQLINTSIYEKESQSRSKAIAETRRQKLRQRDEVEKLKVSRHLQHTARASDSSVDESNRELSIHGIRFQVARNGSKLIKVLGDQSSAKLTPKTAMVGGVRFYRSKNGNMYRSGIVKAQRRSGVVKKINEPCKTFTTLGSCLKGPRCRYTHDPSKVAVCKDFLLKGSCLSGESCDLSHSLTPERTPTCLHFAKGNCSNPNCRYTHVHVSPAALNCRPFGIYGFCEKGARCAERHAHECPDFSNTGTCTTKGCKLIHRHKASVIRKKAAATHSGTEEEQSDLSSEEDHEEIDSDDVDSDDLEELFADEDGRIDTDVPTQQDFVRLA